MTNISKLFDSKRLEITIDRLCQQIIENHKTGFITFENDHTALAKSIIEFLKSDNIEDILVNAKKNLTQNFNAKKQSYKLQNIFQENI